MRMVWLSDSVSLYGGHTAEPRKDGLTDRELLWNLDSIQLNSTGNYGRRW